MICKNCGANIEESSKFCGVCGNKVEEINNFNLGNVDVTTSIMNENNFQNDFAQTNLGQNLSNNFIEEQNKNVQLNDVNQVEEVVTVATTNSVQPNTNSPKKKSHAWIFILLGVLLGVIAIALLVFSFIKSSNTPVRELERALNSISEKGENSGTIDAKILIESDTSDTYNLTATLKYGKNYDNYDIALTLNKSLLYEEMNFYATITDEDVTLFANSSLIDMLGLTSSPTDMWVYFLMTFDELEIEDEFEEEYGYFYLSDILDKEHYKLIDEQNGLKHYQLTIDNELLNKIKAQAPNEEELREFEQSLSEINGGSTELTEVYYVDVYINSNGELSKVSMNLTEEIDDETINKIVISFEFSNFGSTTISIPSEANDSMIDLETYMSTYAIIDNTYDDNYYEEEYNYGV